MFHEFVEHSLRLFPDLSWVVFADPEYDWTLEHPNLTLDRSFTGNAHLPRRLWADHILLPVRARSLGASALVTVGFVPLLKTLPTAMHMNVLTHVSGNDELGRFRRFYRHSMMRRGFRTADLVISNSCWASNEILKAAPWCRNRLTVSYEGLQHEIFKPESDPDEVEGLKHEFGIHPGYFLWVSNFYVYKQADLLLRGYARLHSDLRRKHPLVMAGGSHGGADAAQSLARELGIGDNVRFLGWIEDKVAGPAIQASWSSLLCQPRRDLWPQRRGSHGLRNALRVERHSDHERSKCRTRNPDRFSGYESSCAISKRRDDRFSSPRQTSKGRH